MAESSFQNFDPIEPFPRTMSWTDKLILPLPLKGASPIAVAHHALAHLHDVHRFPQLDVACASISMVAIS